MTTKLTNYSKFIHKSRYARYIDELGRRESWEETVAKSIPWADLQNAIFNLEVMPSMRVFNDCW